MPHPVCYKDLDRCCHVLASEEDDVGDRAVAQPDFCSSVSHIVGDVLDNAAFTQVSRARA